MSRNVLALEFSISKMYCANFVGRLLQGPLIGEVVVTGDRLVQPAFARGLVIVHGRDDDVARIANEMEDSHVFAIKQGREVTEI